MSLLIDVVAWGDDIHGLKFGLTGSSDEGIHARPFQYSDEPMRYNGPALLSIYKMPSSGEGGFTPPVKPETDQIDGRSGLSIADLLTERRKKEPNLVALVKLPVDSRRVTLLLSPAEGGTYKVYVINNDPSKLPAGQLSILNLSSHEIAMQFGDEQPVVIRSQQDHLFDSSEAFVTYRIAYRLKYRPESNKEWKIHGGNVIRLSNDEQMQMIVLQSENQFFRSSSGSRSGYLQTIVLRRYAE